MIQLTPSYNSKPVDLYQRGNNSRGINSPQNGFISLNGYKGYLNITGTPTNSSYFDTPVNNNVNNVNKNNNYVGSDKFDDVNLPNMFTNFKI